MIENIEPIYLPRTGEYCPEQEHYETQVLKHSSALDSVDAHAVA
jgi:hypothetical protein